MDSSRHKNWPKKNIVAAKWIWNFFSLATFWAVFAVGSRKIFAAASPAANSWTSLAFATSKSFGRTFISLWRHMSPLMKQYSGGNCYRYHSQVKWRRWCIRLWFAAVIATTNLQRQLLLLLLKWKKWRSWAATIIHVTYHS